MAPRRDPTRDQAIIERYLSSDLTWEEIAAEFKVSRQTVSSVLKRNNVATKTQQQRNVHPPEAVEALQAVLRLSQAYLGEQVGEDFYAAEVQRYVKRWLDVDEQHLAPSSR